MTITPEAFLRAAQTSTLSGSTPWASQYAAEIRRLWAADSARDPRSVQRRLGPSELGVACDRQVVGKMAGLAPTNHVHDPWPSIRGRALHSYAERVFGEDNQVRGLRWLTEQRVTPHPEHPGTADLYDAAHQAVVDHKFLGASSMAKMRGEPPRKYRRQLYLYAHGYTLRGLPVRRTVLVAYPATAASLDGLYVHEWPYADASGALLPEVAAELADTLRETALRRGLAGEVAAGRLDIMSVPASPDPSECFFCPLYRPEAARDSGPGCPGTVPAPPSA